MTSWTPAAALACALLIGCAPSLKPEDDGGGGSGLGGSGKIVTSDNGDGTYTTFVDSSDAASFIYFDFESQAEVTVDKPLNSTAWDVGFSRHLIPSNGGISGPGGVVISVLEGATFGELEQAPAIGYLTDAEDIEDDGDDDPDFVFNAVATSWFDYNANDHTLSPADRVYVVRSAEGNHYELRFDGYYDNAGTAGHPSFTWRPIGTPSTPDSFTVDATDPTDWVYLSIAKGGMVAVAGDPMASSEWDIALQNTIIRTNSGTSGMALGGARIAPEGSSYEETDSSPTFGFTPDIMIPAPGPPGSGEVSGHDLMNQWYHYDSLSHTVTTKGEVYLIRTAQGDYGKFQIIYYADGVYELRLAPVARVVSEETASIEASDDNTWSYFSFRLGDLVEPEEAATSMDWDIALSTNKVQTNSGSSGAGSGGALDPMQSQLSAISDAATMGYSVDEMLNIDGTDFSGNAVLSDWFETGTTDPKDAAYLLRAADGSYVKLKVDSYSAGTYTLRWSYAGLGQTSF